MPKSRQEGFLSKKSIVIPWNLERFPGFISLEKCLIVMGALAVLIFNGLGPLDTLPVATQPRAWRHIPCNQPDLCMIDMACAAEDGIRIIPPFHLGVLNHSKIFR